MMRALSPIGKVDTMLLESLINSPVGGILLRGNLVGVNFLPFGLLMILQPLHTLLSKSRKVQPSLFRPPFMRSTFFHPLLMGTHQIQSLLSN
uniref:Uncharacterized protein n=1 Tax=Medicago truncatula TaxID=3880 RepID=I3SX51_MEDTR|nr:unknown [Medicago truncatula]